MGLEPEAATTSNIEEASPIKTTNESEANKVVMRIPPIFSKREDKTYSKNESKKDDQRESHNMEY